MKKTSMKKRIIAGLLCVITVFSAASFAAVSASAAETQETATAAEKNKNDNDILYEYLKKIVNKEKDEAERRAREEAADTREGRTVVIADGVEKEYANFYQAWNKATAAKEATLKLNSDLNGVENLIVPSGMKLTVELKGHTINADGALFKIDRGADCTISGGNINDSKTAVTANGSTTLKGLRIKGSKDSAVKGGEGAKVVVDGCEFNANEGVKGGAVYLPYFVEGSVIKNSVFENNSSSEEGGAVYTNRGLINCIFKNNRAGSEGGALYVSGNKEYIRKSLFENNSANTNGGAAAVSQEYTVFEECDFNNNSANNCGGAIYAPEKKDINVNKCKINGSYAGNRGGGVYTGYRAILSLENSEVTNNSAGELGGGLYLGALLYYNHEFTNVTITGNKAKLAGGVYADAGAACAADINFHGIIGIKDNADNDLYLMKDCGKKAKVYTKNDFCAKVSLVYLNSSESSETAVVDLNEKTDEEAFRADNNRSLSRGFLFNETLYIE